MSLSQKSLTIRDQALEECVIHMVVRIPLLLIQDPFPGFPKFRVNWSRHGVLCRGMQRQVTSTRVKPNQQLWVVMNQPAAATIYLLHEHTCHELEMFCAMIAILVNDTLADSLEEVVLGSDCTPSD